MKALLTHLSDLTVSQGRLAGRPFHVLPWKARFVRGVFREGCQSAALSVARGNGKTALLSGIVCATLDGPLAVPRGETVIVASSFEQARIAFEHVLAFMGDKLKDKARWKVWDTAQQERVEHRETGARVRCVGSDPRRAHGLAPVLVLADEPAQWPGNTGERMVAALRTAAGKQPHSRFVALGTRPAKEDHWFAKMLEGGCDFAQIHAASDDAPPFRKRTWQRANPSLAYLPDLEVAIRTEASEAKRDPSMMAAFRALRLNQGTDDIVQSTLLDAGTWRRITGDAPREGRCTWGLDLGQSEAMAAVAGILAGERTGRSARELPARAWTRRAWLGRWSRQPVRPHGATRRACHDGGEAVDIAELIGLAWDAFGAPSAMAADRWRVAELRDILKRIGLPMCPLYERGQGFKDGGEDVRDFRRACIEGKVTPAPSLLLTAAMGEARTVSDPAGNAKLAKSTQGGRRRRAKDDAAAAAILAVAFGSRRAQKPPRRGFRHALVR